MKQYVFYVSVAQGNMGGSWEEPKRRIIDCADDEAAKAKMREINANWASVLTCYPLEAEVNLHKERNN